MIVLLLATLSAFAEPTVDPDTGLATAPSVHTVAKTVQRIKHIVIGKGLFTFAEIDHHKGAARVNVEVPGNTVVLFGTPRVGSQLIAANPAAGLDLPLKMLVHETEGGTEIVWLDPAAFAARHGIEGQGKVIADMTATLTDIAEYAGGDDVTQAGGDAATAGEQAE